MAQLVDVDEGAFEQVVLKSNVPVLVDLWATWCGPCQALGTKLEELSSEFQGRVSIVKVNVETSPEISVRYGVRGVPAMLIFRDGELCDSLHGNQSKERIREALTAAAQRQ